MGQKTKLEPKSIYDYTKILEEFTKYNDINVDLVIFNEMDRIYY